MDLNEDREGGVVVLGPSGRIDHESADDFEKALLPFVEACRDGGALVLDLERVEYMSSAGLRVLMVAAKSLQPHQGTMVICGLRSVMAEIFRISRFDHLFPVYDGRAAALAALG